MPGYKTWVADEVLTAADLNNFLMGQSVTIWASATTRNAGILSPTEGQISYLQDVNLYQSWNGSAWVSQATLAGTATNATYATTAGTATYATTAGTAVNANKVGNITIFNSSTTPTANATGDLWFY